MPRKRKAQEEEVEAPAEQDKTSSSSTPKRSARETTHGFEALPTSKAYRLIEPGPVLLVTTGLSLDDSNVMTIGFHMVMQHEAPPLIGITLGPWDASFATLKKQRECVLAIPSVEMASVVVDVGNCSANDDEETSKWERFGLEKLPAKRVKAPLVGGSNIIANIECVVEDTKMVSKYSMWVLKPVKAWINPNKMPGKGGKMFHHRGDGTFVVDGDILDLKDRMVKWQEFQD